MPSNGRIDVDNLKARATGQWPRIIADVAGIDSAILDGRHHPCPRCGGENRFRLIDSDAGACYCNKCFSKGNGDGIAAVQWLLRCDFPTALKHVANYLGVSPISNGHKNRNGSAKTNGHKPVDFDSQVKWLSINGLGQLSQDRHFEKFAEAKQGVTIDAIKASNARICRWPAKSNDQLWCVAVPARRAKTGDVCGYILYRTDGEDFPTVPNGPQQRKTHMLRGSKDGLVIVGGWDALADATAAVKVEGLPDALAIHSKLPAGHVSVTNISGCNSVKLPLSTMKGKRLIVVGDADEPGQEGAKRFAQDAAAKVNDVRIATLPYDVTPDHGKDVRDFINEGGNVQELLAGAVKVEPAESPTIDPDDDRPEIQITTDEYLINAAAVDALAADHSIYQRGGRLVHVVQEAAASNGIHRPEGTSRIADLPEAVLRDRLSATARFTRETKDGIEAANPPGWCVKAVHTFGSWPNIRPLNGITAYPLLRSDGTILSHPGYDSQTGMLLQPTGPMPTISSNPTRADALSAVELLNDVVTEFPFAKPEHKSAWLAALLTPAARHTFCGPAPLFLIDANAAGSGKGLLADSTSFILTGREMSVMSNPRNDDEARKRITSLVMQADPIILIDNIAGALGCPSLDAALTATHWKDRKLGGNEMVDMPIRATWFATGNNVALQADTSRRVCHIRIDSKVENPEEREGFKYPNLRAHVREHQSELLAAVLTILGAWFVAGKPNANLKPWGSYEGWSGVVRNAIVWLGLPDPGMTRQELRDRSDNSAATLRALIAGWEEIDPNGEGLTASSAIELVKDKPKDCPQLKVAMLEYCVGKNGNLPSPRSLGMRLKHATGTIAGGKYFDSRTSSNTKIWFVRSVSEGGTSETEGTTPTPPYAGAHTHARTRESGGAGISPSSPDSPLVADEFESFKVFK